MAGMFTWEFVVTGQPDAARSAVQAALEAQQFRIEDPSAPEWHATHGDQPSFMSKFLGQAQFPLVLTVKFAPDARGTAVQLHRPVIAGTGGLTRNPNELATMDRGYRAAAEAVREHLAAAGVLADGE